jgi:hypothetical protein|tara:strand:- start:993 stop:1619 length:627 start_codon:yes stop_codon:yes gene_type:complete
MAISTYSELKTAIANWLDRSDLTDVIPDFIALAETRHKRDFKIRRMETRVTANTIADTEYYTLPDDYIAMRNIKLNTDTKTPLEFLTPEIMDRLQAGSSVGKPKAYSIKGNTIQLRPIPDGVYEIEIAYYKTFTALSDSNTTNDMLTHHPDAYLYGALVEAEPYLQNDKRLQVWAGLYDRAKEDIIKSNERDRHSGTAPVTRIDYGLY